MKQKINQLNGFDFTHERHNFGGVWVFNWSFKPIEMNEWCPFSLPTGKTKKADMEGLLHDREAATAYYVVWLERASNVEAAERRLNFALEKLKRVSDPEWGGRGNNPDKDARIVRQVHYEVDAAETELSSAKALKARLTK